MGKIKALIIEDRQDDIELLLLELDRDGIEYEWISVETREEFLEKLTPDVDIILADYNLPQFSAPEALQLLQNTEIDAPFIVVTGSISEEVAVACMKDGAADYLIKDRLSRLGGAIRQAIEKRNLERAQKDAAILKLELEKERELREYKSRFVSMIVHDFRNPLSAIRVTTDMLKQFRGMLDEQKLEEKFDVILERTAHLSRLIDDVLLIGRMESSIDFFAPSIGNLVEFCESIFDEFFNRVDTNLFTPRFDVKGSAEPIEFDQGLLDRALYNLLSNAMKYSPEGGVIAMEISFDEIQVVISVTDNGIGISEKDQKFLFESFHRATNVGDIQGAGLGLAIVKQVADMHGGHVDLSSREHIGSKFCLTIPFRPIGTQAAD
ncbi:MAG: hybrid sensor histidine kinase/response regulator [Chloroflexota bacterium]